MSKNNKTNKPVFQFKAGKVSGSVFVNEHDDNFFYSSVITKSYNDGSERKQDWKNTNNYNSNDLPDLNLVSNEIYKYVRTHFASDEKEE